VGVIVMQWHTAMTHVTELPIAYSYAMLLIDRRVFGKLSEDDQAVVTDVMRRVYAGFDRRGEAEDQEARQALLDDGLESVTVSAEERGEWKRLIDASNRQAGAAGEFDLALLEEIECLLDAFRNGGDGQRCGP
jgi:TRAP-type C4-dicarboxylate transport system substrate-binding protein